MKQNKRSDVIIDLSLYYLDDNRYDECKTLLTMGNNKEAMIAWETGASSFKGSETQNSYKKLCSELKK
jgi:hypothetical protein